MADKRHRDAGSGRFTTEHDAENRPGETVAETVRRQGPVAADSARRAGVEPDALFTVHLEDSGQDFLEFDIDGAGCIVGCRPFQGRIWTGKLANVVGRHLYLTREKDPEGVGEPEDFNWYNLEHLVERIEWHGDRKPADPLGPIPPDVLRDMLSLVMDPFPGEDQLAGWTEAEREEAQVWAANVHLRASDHDDLEPVATPGVIEEWQARGCPGAYVYPDA